MVVLLAVAVVALVWHRYRQSSRAGGSTDGASPTVTLDPRTPQAGESVRFEVETGAGETASVGGWDLTGDGTTDTTGRVVTQFRGDRSTRGDGEGSRILLGTLGHHDR